MSYNQLQTLAETLRHNPTKPTPTTQAITVALSLIFPSPPEPDIPHIFMKVYSEEGRKEFEAWHTAEHLFAKCAKLYEEIARGKTRGQFKHPHHHQALKAIYHTTTGLLNGLPPADIATPLMKQLPEPEEGIYNPFTGKTEVSQVWREWSNGRIWLDRAKQFITTIQTTRPETITYTPCITGIIAHLAHITQE